MKSSTPGFIVESVPGGLYLTPELERIGASYTLSPYIFETHEDADRAARLSGVDNYHVHEVVVTIEFLE